jgi:hypothetical protein
VTWSRYCLKTHPYYHAEAFPDQAQYAGWRVKEQMRLAEAIEHVQGMPVYEGSLVLRVRQGTGIHHEEEVRASFVPPRPRWQSADCNFPVVQELTDAQERAEYTCQLSLGTASQCSKRVNLEPGGGGIARWDEEWTVELHEEPGAVTLEVVQHTSIAGAAAALLASKSGKAAATVERLAGGNQLLGRLGGKKVAGKLGDKRELREERRNQVVGSTRLPPLEQLWCPPPQSTTHHLELHGEAGVAGVLTFDLQYAFRRVTQSTRGALVCTSALPRVPCLLSAYYKCTVLDWSEESRLFDGMGETLETIHKKAHKLFRVLVQSLARSEAAHAARECEREGAHDGGVGSGMTLAPAVGWLFDQFCEIFGVGEPYRRLYELRVVLSGFEPSAGCLGRVSVALNDVLHLKELGITDWTTDELDMYQAMRLHLQESLSRCFLYYKSIFPPTSVHSGALELAAHIFCVLTPDGADELLRTNVMQHADKTVAMILRGVDVDGGMVRPRVLSCLLRELRKELVEDHDFYGPVFPQDVRLVETHCSQYFGVDSRVRNAIANCVMNMDEKAYFEDEALQLYDDAANVAMCGCFGRMC